MFNVGDRVRVIKTEDPDGWFPGIEDYEGLIILDKNNIMLKGYYIIDFGVCIPPKNPLITGTHDCQYLPKSTGRWCKLEELELVLDKQVNYIEDKEYEAMLV